MWSLGALCTIEPMDFCTTRNPENDMNTSKLFDLTSTDGAVLSAALRVIPVALLLAAFFS